MTNEELKILAGIDPKKAKSLSIKARVIIAENGLGKMEKPRTNAITIVSESLKVSEEAVRYHLRQANKS